MGQKNPRICYRCDPAGDGYLDWSADQVAEPPFVEPAQEPPRLLSDAEYGQLRAAESCAYRNGCACRGQRCKPGGRRAGELVTIADCLDCVSKSPD